MKKLGVGLRWVARRLSFTGWRRMNLQVKIGLFVFAGLLVVFGLLGYLGLHALSQSTDRTLDERLILAETVAQGMDQTLSQSLEQLKKFATAEAVDLEDGDLAPEKEALEELYQYSGPYIANTFLLDREGGVVWIVPQSATGTGPFLARYPNVAETFRTGEPQVSGDVSSPADGALMVSLSVPIWSNAGKMVGVVGSTFGPAQSFVGSLVQPVSLGETSYLEVVNEEGMVLASTRPSTETDPFADTEHAERFSALITEGRAVVRTCHRCHNPEGTGERREDVMAFAPLSTAPWGVGIRQSEEEAFALTRDLERNIFVFGSVALLVAVVGAWFGARAIVRPVRQLTTASEKMAAGHLDEPIAVRSRDEIGQLARTFETMRQRLNTSRQEIEQRTADLERRNRELASMASIAEVVSLSLDIDRILDQALDRLLATVEAEAGGIFLREGSQGMVLRVQRGLSPELLPEMGELAGHDAVSFRAIAAAGKGPKGAYGLEAEAERQPQSSCRVPLVAKGEVIGSVVVIRRGERPFSSQEIGLMTAITNQIGMAVGNAELFQETRKRERETEALYEIGVKISALLDIDKILDTVVDSARQLLEAEVAILTLLDENTREVYVKSASGACDRGFEQIRIKAGEGLSGRVIALGQPVTSSEYLRDTSFSHDQEADSLVRDKGLRSFLAVPLSVGGTVLGALIVAARKQAEYPESDVDVLSRLANQAAIAVENARLYLRAQETAALEERDRIAREMHDSLSQVLGYLSIEASAVEQKLAAGQLAAVKEELAEMRKAARDAYEDVRQGILALRTAGSLTKGFVPSLDEFVQEYGSQSGLTVEVDVADERATQFSPKAEGQLLRIIQEALTNVRKHANATHVGVRFELQDSWAQITVEDDGQGFETVQARRGRHFGLQTMRERAESIGGKLAVESKVGAGTRVVVRVPWEQEGANNNASHKDAPSR
ncbi:MAG: GAF domain-containing protein [Chloroflexota bacterium]|nr:GAF domain-containing protein [Chloroflexota bacterium]